MTALEVRLIVLAVLLFAAGWGGYTLASHHDERLAQAKQVAQDAQVQAQQDKVIADLKVQQAATAAAEQKYVDLKNATAGVSDQLARSVSEYAALRRNVVSATASTAARADAASQGTSRDSELASLVRQATEACEGDAVELTALQTWASQVSH